MRLHHLALGARDVENVAAFYRDMFDLPQVAQHHAPDGSLRSIWLDLGDSLLMVERSQAPARAVEDVGSGAFLIAFRIDPTERAQVEARLVQRGSPIESRTACTSYARDPEGNRVAISHYSRKE